MNAYQQLEKVTRLVHLNHGVDGPDQLPSLKRLVVPELTAHGKEQMELISPSIVKAVEKKSVVILCSTKRGVREESARIVEQYLNENGNIVFHVKSENTENPLDLHKLLNEIAALVNLELSSYEGPVTVVLISDPHTNHEIASENYREYTQRDMYDYGEAFEYNLKTKAVEYLFQIV